MSLETEGKYVSETDDVMGLLSGDSLKAERVGAVCTTDVVSLATEEEILLHLMLDTSGRDCCIYWLQTGPDTWHHYAGFEKSARFS